MIKVSHEEAVVSTSQSAMDRLKNFLIPRGGVTEGVQDMESFERELHRYFVEAERAVTRRETTLEMIGDVRGATYTALCCHSACSPLVSFGSASCNYAPRSVLLCLPRSAWRGAKAETFGCRSDIDMI